MIKDVSFRHICIEFNNFSPLLLKASKHLSNSIVRYWNAICFSLSGLSQTWLSEQIDRMSFLRDCEDAHVDRVRQFKPKSPLLLSLLWGSSHRLTYIHTTTRGFTAFFIPAAFIFTSHTTLSNTISFVPFFLPTLVSEFHRDRSVAFCHSHRNAHRSEFGRLELQNQSVDRPGSFTRLSGIIGYKPLSELLEDADTS